MESNGSPLVLHQVIALEKGIKGQSNDEFTQLYLAVQKSPLLSGIARKYTPKDDDGDQLPSESTKVQLKIEDALRDTQATLTRLFDITLTKDHANTQASADIVVDGTVLAKDVPVTFLLFLEKRLADLRTFISKLPVLDPAETWVHDDATDMWATVPTQTTRTKKVPRNHVLAPATDKHPAQVTMYHEDVVVGYWQTVKFSGALEQARVNDFKDRISRLIQAVKVAREKANSALAPERAIGAKLFGYLFS